MKGKLQVLMQQAWWQVWHSAVPLNVYKQEDADRSFLTKENRNFFCSFVSFVSRWLRIETFTWKAEWQVLTLNSFLILNVCPWDKKLTLNEISRSTIYLRYVYFTYQLSIHLKKMVYLFLCHPQVYLQKKQAINTMIKNVKVPSRGWRSTL